MFLRRKQKPDEYEQLIPHAWTWQTTEREVGGRSKSRKTEFSKLSAQMVELSLQEAQRERTLRGASPKDPSTVSSPSLWPTDVQRITESPAESGGGPNTVAPKATIAAPMPLNPPQAHGTYPGLRLPNFAVLYSWATVILREMTNYRNEVPRMLGSWLATLRVTGSDAVGNLRGRWNSVQKDHRLATFRARILGRFTIAAQRTDVVLQRTAILIGRWSRWVATTAQFLAAQISAELSGLKHSQRCKGLRQTFRSNFRVLMARAPAVCEVMKKKFAAHRGSRLVVPTTRGTGRGPLDRK
jgi:hypothetical protein